MRFCKNGLADQLFLLDGLVVIVENLFFFGVHLIPLIINKLHDFLLT
jgi:hypothetical protein